MGASQFLCGFSNRKLNYNNSALIAGLGSGLTDRATIRHIIHPSPVTPKNKFATNIPQKSLFFLFLIIKVGRKYSHKKI
jgi:hypothetical protein